MEKHTLYILGGLARTGKSTIAAGIRQKRLFVTPSPDDLCHPIVKNIFAKELPPNTEGMTFEGVAIYDASQQKKPFDFSVPIALSAAKVTEKNLLIELPTDYIRFIIRMIFAGENRGLSGMGFEGEASFTGGDKTSKRPIKIEYQGEDLNAWNALTGIIADYDRQNENDILIEGVAIKPDKIKELALENLAVKAAFLGYNDEAYATPLLAYLQTEAEKKKDYLYGEMKNSGKSEEDFVRDWMREVVKAGNLLREQAKASGLEYFDVTSHGSFEEYIQAVINYLFPIA